MEMLIELGISRSNQMLLNCTAWKQADEKCCRSEKKKKGEFGWWYLIFQSGKEIKFNEKGKETVHYDKLFEIEFCDCFMTCLPDFWNYIG